MTKPSPSPDPQPDSLHVTAGAVAQQGLGDRRIGEGREHIEENDIHPFGPYDYEVDTTRMAEVADAVLTAWRGRGRQRALV